MLESQVYAREISDRLRKPRNGRKSSELDIISPAKYRQHIREMQERERQLCIQARGKLGADLVERFRREVGLWAVSMAKQIPDIPKLPRIRMDQIIPAVCKFYGINELEVMSARREASIVRPRHVIVYLAATLTILSLPQIGRRIGGKDHSTVVNARDKMIERMATDLDLAAEVAQIREQLLKLEGA